MTILFWRLRKFNSMDAVKPYQFTFKPENKPWLLKFPSIANVCIIPGNIIPIREVLAEKKLA